MITASFALYSFTALRYAFEVSITPLLFLYYKVEFPALRPIGFTGYSYKIEEIA